jgi:hypothetical protein
MGAEMRRHAAPEDRLAGWRAHQSGMNMIVTRANRFVVGQSRCFNFFINAGCACAKTGSVAATVRTVFNGYVSSNIA